MTYGAQNFLEGLSAIVQTVSADAASIARMRIGAAREKAAADTSMMTTDFVLKLKSGEIKPEKFGEAWESFQISLDDYASQYEYEPAREIVAGDIASRMPEIKLNLGLAANEMHLQAIEMDTRNTIGTIMNNAGMTADQRKAGAEAVLGRAKLNP